MVELANVSEKLNYCSFTLLVKHERDVLCPNEKKIVCLKPFSFVWYYLL